MIVYEASLLFCKKFLKMKKKFDYANIQHRVPFIYAGST